MRGEKALARGRDAYNRRAWGEAYAHFSGVDGEIPLDDLERLAVVAYLTGRDERSVDAWAEAHRRYLNRSEVPRAARCAFWVALQLFSAREPARAGGWVATASRLLDEGAHDCAERGLLLVLSGRALLRRDAGAARDAFTQAVAIGQRLEDGELKILSRLAQGQWLARNGDVRAALALFDEMMVAVTTGDVSPIVVGTVYCAVIDACHEMLDVDRAREWTAALSGWCDADPELVAFRGQCLVHRAETMRMSGAWDQALAETGRACRAVTGAGGGEASNGPTPDARTFPVGAAFYETAEVHRLAGRFADADRSYRLAHRHGVSPQPGMGLLRLAEGRPAAAAAAIRRACEEPQGRRRRVWTLSAAVHVLLECGDTVTARHAADELSTMASEVPAPMLVAASCQASGACRLASGDARGALADLRMAWQHWQAVEMPYEAASVRVLLAAACRQLGDSEAADLELDGARRVFARLGAAPDVARVDGLSGLAGAGTALTSREREVLGRVAAGATNRAIAVDLGISPRTVDRHVSNILTKLSLPSRSAATAYAYEHHLVGDVGTITHDRS